MRRMASIVRRGLGVAFGGWRLLGLLLAVNLAAALVAILPMAATLDRVLSPLGNVDGLLQRWPAWLRADLQAHAADPIAIFQQQGAVVLLLFTLLSAFLSAGIMGVLHDADGAFSLGGFCRGCGRYGFAFLRLLLLFALVAWLLAWWGGAQLGAGFEALSFNWPSQRGARLLTAGHQALVLAAFYLLTWIMDMSRVRLVVESRRSALGAFLAGVSITCRRLGTLTVLLGSLAVLQAVALALAGWCLRRWMPESWAGLTLFFLASQAIIGARIGLRVAGLECGRRWLLQVQDTAAGAGEPSHDGAA